MAKFLFIVTGGQEHPERATIPFSIATAALSLGHSVTMVLQVDAVDLLCEEVRKTIAPQHFTPLSELFELYVELGGKLLACSPCLKLRGLSVNDIHPSVTIVAASTVVKEAAEADKIFSY